MSSAVTALATVNALGSLAAAGAAVTALVRPAVLLQGVRSVQRPAEGAGAGLFAQLYAARALPLSAVSLGLLAAVALGSGGGSGGSGGAGGRDALAAVLVVAGLAQGGDCAIGVARRVPGMAVSSGVLAALHLGSAWWLRR